MQGMTIVSVGVSLSVFIPRETDQTHVDDVKSVSGVTSPPLPSPLMIHYHSLLASSIMLGLAWRNPKMQCVLHSCSCIASQSY